MKQTLLFSILVIAAGLTVGCQSKVAKPDSEKTPIEKASVKLDKVKAETKEAAHAIKEYAYAEKAEFVDKMNSGLMEMQSEMDRLSAKVDQENSELKADAQAQLEAVREKWAQAKKQLDQAESATESDWNDVKDGINESYNDLSDSYNATRQWLSDKIEP